MRVIQFCLMKYEMIYMKSLSRTYVSGMGVDHTVLASIDVTAAGTAVIGAAHGNAGSARSNANASKRCCMCL